MKENFILDLRLDTIAHLSMLQRLQRAIGVIYRPETERASHYYFSKLPNQFDALIHVDKTQALLL